MSATIQQFKIYNVKTYSSTRILGKWWLCTKGKWCMCVKDYQNGTCCDYCKCIRKTNQKGAQKCECLIETEPLCFDNIKELEQEIGKTNNYHLRLEPGKQYILYGDLDGLNIPIEDAIEHVKNAYEKILNIKINSISYTTNDDYKKAPLTSHHYSIPEYNMNINMQSSLKGEINNYLKEYNIEIDKSVYNDKWFRICNQKKGIIDGVADKGIHKVIVGKNRDFIMEYIPKKSIKLEYQTKKDIDKSIKNIKDVKTCENVNKCDTKININEVEDLLNILDKTKRAKYKKWTKICMLLRNYGLKEQCINFSKNMEKFNQSEIEKIFNQPPKNKNIGIGSLKYYAKKDNAVEYEKICEKYRKKVEYKNIYDDIYLVQNKCNITYEEETERITVNAIKKICNATTSIIMSCTGSGKTTVIKKYIIDKFPTKSILSISAIRSLAKAQENDFGLTSYLNGKTNGREIISYEQLSKRANEKYDVLILDEITSLLAHLTSTTMKNKALAYTKLTQLIKESTQVICSDAIMTDAVYNFIASIRENIFFYRNTYKRWQGVNLNIVSCESEEVLNKKGIVTKKGKKMTEEKKIKKFLEPLISSHIENHKTCAIVSDSRKYIDMAKEIIGDNFMKIFTSEHGNIDNINAEYFKNKCIGFSPRIIYGVNIDETVKYDSDSIYVIYKGRSINSMAMLQQIGRFRGVKGNINILFMQNGYTARQNYFTSIDEIKETLILNMNDCIKAGKNINEKMEILQSVGCNYDADTGYTVNEKSRFFNEYSLNLWYEALFERNKSQAFISLCKYYGYSVSHKNLTKNEKAEEDNEKIQINSNTLMIEKCTKYINNELAEDDDDFIIISEKCDQKMILLKTTKSKVKENKRIFDLVVNDDLFKACMKSNILFQDNDIINKRFENFDIYNIIDINAKNPATMALILYIEKLTNIKRFNVDAIDEKYNDIISEYVKNNKSLVANALYGFSNISKKLKEERIDKKIGGKITGKFLLIDLYNQYADIFEKKIIDKKTKKTDLVLNKELLNYISKFQGRLGNDISYMFMPCDNITENLKK